jgi:hypothetical protein
MERIQLGGRRVAGFGVGDIFLPPAHTSDEVEALIRVFDARMQQLSDSFKEFGAKWMSTDPASFSQFVADYVLLQARYAAAKIKAASATGFWASAGDSEAAYTAIMKAVRQNYPPDGADVKSGDWTDLYARLAAAQKAANAPMIVDQPPPDLANVQSDDLTTKLYKLLAPVDVIAQVKGDEAKTKAVKEALDTFEWIQAHKTGVAIGATIVVGGILYAIVRR